MAEKLAEVLKPKAEANKVEAGKKTGRGHKKVSSILTEPLDTRAAAAKEAGVSAGSMAAYKFIKEHAPASPPAYRTPPAG